MPIIDAEPRSREPESPPLSYEGMMPLTRHLRETFLKVWDGADLSGAFDSVTYAREEQVHHERRLRALVDAAISDFKTVRADRTREAEVQSRVLGSFSDFACSSLGWDAHLLRGPLADDFARALRAFPVLARDFDPALKPTDIYQAARNAITFHCLQQLLGVPVRPTPSSTAYSLLYPYTDNYLDNQSLGMASKLAFGDRLAQRLRGDSVRPATSHERRIFKLVEMIEGEHRRSERPRVFDSLLAIHAAQQNSLVLLHRGFGLATNQIVDISIEKGGTSVLADGYLTTGDLTAEQAECVYGLGVFLQLRDDLEDVTDDIKNGQQTVFSSLSVGQRLDEPTARALAIGSAVIDRLDCFPCPAASSLCDLMRRSLRLTITDAAASSAKRYSPAFLQRLERRSPIGLAFIVEQRRRLARANGSLTSVLQAWLGGSGSAWPDAALLDAGLVARPASA